MRCVVIRPGEAPVIRNLKGWSGIKAELGGGYLELVPVGRNFTLYVDEDGIARGLPLNPLATRLARGMLAAAGRQLLQGDYIKGVAVFCGSRANGAECDLPAKVIAEWFPELKEVTDVG